MEIGKQKQPGGCFCRTTLCFQPQIGLFPGHHAGVAAEMPVAGHLGKAGRGQVKAADDGGGTAICLVHDGLINPMFRDRSGAKGVDADGHGFRQTDGVAELYFAPFRPARRHDVLGDIPGHIRCGAIYFGSVLAAERAAPMPGIAAVCVHNDFPARQSAVACRAPTTKRPVGLM